MEIRGETKTNCLSAEKADMKQNTKYLITGC